LTLPWLQTPRFLKIVKCDSAGAKRLLAACRASGFALLRQQAHIIHAGCAHSVNRIFNRPVLRPRIRANEDCLARRIL
jgi:hypothetical protein